jgi:hypothetical protein
MSGGIDNIDQPQQTNGEKDHQRPEETGQKAHLFLVG